MLLFIRYLNLFLRLHLQVDSDDDDEAEDGSDTDIFGDDQGDDFIQPVLFLRLYF